MGKKWEQKKFLLDLGGKKVTNLKKSSGIKKPLMRASKCSNFHQNPISIGYFEVHTPARGNYEYIILKVPKLFDNHLTR